MIAVSAQLKVKFEARKGRMTRWSTEKFQGSGTIVHAIKMDTYHYAFIKIYLMYNTKNEP